MLIIAVNGNNNAIQLELPYQVLADEEVKPDKISFCRQNCRNPQESPARRPLKAQIVCSNPVGAIKYPGQGFALLAFSLDTPWCQKFVKMLLSSGLSGSQTFYNCNALVGGNGTTYASSRTGYTYMRIDAANQAGYLTAA